MDYTCTPGPIDKDCNPYRLYDIIEDPYEKEDLTNKALDILKNLLKQFNAYAKETRFMQDQVYHNVSELNFYLDNFYRL